MSGTADGGKRAAATNKKRYGADFYRRLGLKGAEAYRERMKQGIAQPRGFALNRELARVAGQYGGRISRRRKAKV